MRVTMSEEGVLTVAAETSLEAYALRRWVAEAITGFCWQGKKLCVDTSLGQLKEPPFPPELEN